MRALVAAALLAAALPADAKPGAVVRVDYHDPDDPPSRGPANAPVTIELFFGPYTHSRQNAYKNLEALQARHPSRIRLVYRVLETNQKATIAPAVLEAAVEGKYFEFMDLINAEKTDATLTRARLLELGDKIGIDHHRLDVAMSHHNAVLDTNAKRLARVNRRVPDALFNGLPAIREVSALGMQDLENEYGRAYDRAMELIDRGADPSALSDAFEDTRRSDVVPDIQASGPVDENIENEPIDPPLANPPLDLRGLPTYGPANAPVPIVVLCKPTSTNCSTRLQQAVEVQRVYPQSVRVVWGPWYDVTQEGGSDLTLLSDAALCAETVGTGDDNPIDDPASSGWRWVKGMFDDLQDRKGRSGAAVETIDRVAKKLRVDPHAFAACRATAAGGTVDRIAAERHSGVRASPSVIVGGRIYHGGVANKASLQALVEAELAPGVLDILAPSWQRH